MVRVKNENSEDSFTREMHKAVCSDCGVECEVPFKPTEGKPTRCNECFSKLRARRPFRRGFDRRPIEMHKAICAECKKECEVPFKPRDNRPVYCKECFESRRNSQEEF